MAIIKEIITDDGFSAEYWKLGSFSIDRNLKEASFTFNLYYTKDHSLGDVNGFKKTYCCTSLMGKEDKALYKEYFENIEKYPDWKKACYDYAMNHETFFQDAVSDEV